MPFKPKKACAYSGCPELTNDRYCPEHKRKVSRDYDKTRGKTAARGYGFNWTKVRKMKLARNPLCECGCNRPAEMVHHIDGDSRNNHFDNLESMTKACHDRLHIKQGDKF